MDQPQQQQQEKQQEEQQVGTEPAPSKVADQGEEKKDDAHANMHHDEHAELFEGSEAMQQNATLEVRLE